MKILSAGILVYKTTNKGHLEVLLAHPGGPFFIKKDQGVWSIPKGEYHRDETALEAAKREFQEEIGQSVPDNDFLDLGEIKRRDGKVISVWAVSGDIDTEDVKSNQFSMEWPPHSGQQQSFPEVDRAAWFSLPEAALKLSSGQSVFLDRLAEQLGLEPPIIPSQAPLL
jgi:predicted NUDIX family NTP pyrophosphohydrolase